MTDESIVAVLQAFLASRDLSISRRSDRSFDLSDDHDVLEGIVSVVMDASSAELEWSEEPTSEVPECIQERLLESCR